jgi:hypothetical protein
MPYADLVAIGDAVRSRVKAVVNALLGLGGNGVRTWFLKTVVSVALLAVNGKKIAGWLAPALGKQVGPAS